MANYSTDSEGKFIPASQRPDGTWRKARRVRDGYVPQEEVPLYKSKGKVFADRKSDLPPGMCPIVAEAARRERERQERAKAKREAAALSLTAAIEAPAKAAAAAAASASAATASKGATTTITTAANSIGKGKQKNIAASSCPSHQQKNTISILSRNVEALTNGLANNLKLDDEPLDRAKQLKKLRKKIREIESIEERLSNGELKKPEKDQLDKVKRKASILKEIQLLEQQQQQHHHHHQQGGNAIPVQPILNEH